MSENILEEKQIVETEIEEPKSADEIDPGDPPVEEDSVIKVKKPRSQKQIESLKKAQESRRKNAELKKAQKVVKAQETIDDLQPPKPKPNTELELVKEMMQIMNPRRVKKRDDSSDSEDSVERLERKLAKKKAQRAKNVPTPAPVPPPAPPNNNIVRKKKMLSFN